MIEAVILYSSNDSKYFQHCVGNLLKLNIPCHVITYTHMWKGTPENMEVYKKSNEMFKDKSIYARMLRDIIIYRCACGNFIKKGTGFLNNKKEEDKNDF